MSQGGIDIPENPDDVRALLAAMQARLLASEQALEAERTALKPRASSSMWPRTRSS